MAKEALIPFRGQLMTYRQIASVVGVSAERVRARYSAGIPVDAPNLRLVRGVGEVAERRRISGVNVTNDKLTYEQDACAQAANQYLIAREPLHSVQEIAELMECDLEDALLYRDELRAVLFRREATLDMVGNILGLSRERIRQIEESACSRARNIPSLMRTLESMRDDAGELDRIRPVDQFAAVASSGTVQIGSWTVKPTGGSRTRSGSE